MVESQKLICGLFMSVIVMLWFISSKKKRKQAELSQTQKGLVLLWLCLTQLGLIMLKVIQSKKRFCQVEIKQFNGKFNSKQFSFWIADLRPWHQQSRAGVSTIFTWRASVCVCVSSSHSLATPPSNLQSSNLSNISHLGSG